MNMPNLKTLRLQSYALAYLQDCYGPRKAAQIELTADRLIMLNNRGHVYISWPISNLESFAQAAKDRGLKPAQ